jgi:predicted nucleic acid-binding Zn ribbon protein
MNNVIVGDLVQEFLVKNGKFSLFLEQRAVELWGQIVGEFIAKQTTKISVKQGVLYVTIPNAALRFEVLGCRSQIVNKINEKLGGEVVKGVIVR